MPVFEKRIFGLSGTSEMKGSDRPEKCTERRAFLKPDILQGTGNCSDG